MVAAQVYPKPLCRTIVHGIVRRAQHDDAGLMSLEFDGFLEIGVDESNPEEAAWKKYWEDLSGQEIAATLTAAAREEEIREIQRMGVYEKVTVE